MIQLVLTWSYKFISIFSNFSKMFQSCLNVGEATHIWLLIVTWFASLTRNIILKNLIQKRQSVPHKNHRSLRQNLNASQASNKNRKRIYTEQQSNGLVRRIWSKLEPDSATLTTCLYFPKLTNASCKYLNIMKPDIKFMSFIFKLIYSQKKWSIPFLFA